MTDESSVWSDGVIRQIVQRVVLSKDADVATNRWLERKVAGIDMSGNNLNTRSEDAADTCLIWSDGTMGVDELH